VFFKVIRTRQGELANFAPDEDISRRTKNKKRKNEKERERETNK